MAAPFLLLALLFAALQFELVRTPATALIERQLAGPDLKVELRGLQAGLPLALRLDRVALADAAGVWLELEGVTLRWRPSALLDGRLVVALVQAERVALARLPAGEPTAPPPSAGPFALPSWPASLPPIAVEQLSFPAIALGQAVLGEAASFAVAGQGGIDADGRHVTAALSARRTDAPTADLNLDLAADLGDQTLRVGLQASDRGGLLLRGQEGAGAGSLALGLTGEGPLAAWPGRLKLTADRFGEVDAALVLGLTGAPSLRLDATARPAPAALPADLTGAVGNEVHLGLTATAPSPSVLTIERADVGTASASFQGRGSLDIATRLVDLTGALELPTLAPLSDIAGTPLTGNVATRWSVTGTLGAPQATLELDGTALGAATLGVAKLQLSARTGAGSAASGVPPALELTANGTATGLSREGQPIGLDSITLELAAARAATGRVTLDRLELATTGASLTGHGEVDPGNLAGSGGLFVAVPSLAALRPLLEPIAPALAALDGAVSIALTGEQGGDGLAKLQLRLGGEGLAGLPAPAGEVLGREPTLSADATVAGDGTVVVSDLAVRGTNLAADGSGNFSPGDGGITGRLTLDLPRLAALSTLTGTATTGRLTAEVAAGGTVQAPTLQLTMNARDVAAGDLAIATAELEARVEGALPVLRGTIKATAVSRGQTLRLEAAAARDGPGLRVTGLTLEAPRTRLTADGRVDLETLRGAGRLEGETADLAALQSFTGLPLKGRIALEAAAEEAGGNQNATAQVQATGLAFGDRHVATMSLAARGSDLFGRPAIDVTLAATDATPSAELTLQRLRLTAIGGLEALDVTATLSGQHATGPLDLDLAGALALKDAGYRLRLARLAGNAAGAPLSLARPAVLSRAADGTLAVEGLALGWGAARLEGDAALGPTAVRGRLALSPTPLQHFAVLGAPPLGGTVAATVSLAGRPAAPTVTVALDARAVTPLTGDRRGLPPADIDLDARLESGRFTASARLAGVTAEPLAAELTVPIALSLAPFSAGVAPGAPLQGSLRGRANLVRLQEIMALDGQRLAGTATLDLRLGGEVSAPRVEGAARISDGAIEDAVSGVSLRDLQLVLTGDGNRLVVERLTASDRGQGRLTGSGILELAGATAARFETRLALTSFQALRNELGSARVGGEITFAGTPSASRVAGLLRIERADLELPAEGGGGPATLPVRVKGEPPPRPAPPTGPSLPSTVALAIAIEAPQQIFLRGRGLESEWGGGLKVAGTAAAPIVTGMIASRRGFFEALDRRFTIRRGEVVFDGAQPPLPRVLIEAVGEGYEITAVVRVVGPADRLKIELASEPSLPQDEILARLMFNRPAGGLTPAQGVQVALAIRNLGSTSAGPLEIARKTLGVDVLDITGSGEDAALSVGRYVGDRVFLQVQQGLTPETSKARVELQLRPGLSASTDVDPEGRTGAQLQWKWDY